MLREFDHTILKCKVKFERTLPSLQVNLFFPLHDIVVLNNEYGADVGRNSTPRVSSRPFS